MTLGFVARKGAPLAPLLIALLGCGGGGSTCANGSCGGGGAGGSSSPTPSSSTTTGSGGQGGGGGEHCHDGARDGDETDVDCGGATCDGCQKGQACDVDHDCRSGICEHGACAPFARAIAAGGDMTCAVTSRGAAKCWGANAGGRLGDGTTAMQRNEPVDVVGLTTGALNVVANANDAGFSLAVRKDGALFGWGHNLNPQPVVTATPAVVLGLTSGAAAAVEGSVHVCVLTTTGGVRCVGQSPELGNGMTTDSTTLVDVTGLTTGVTGIAAGVHHTCAVTSAGAVDCWGSNDAGQLGDGSIMNRPQPVVPLDASSGAIAIGCSQEASCALLASGDVACWGDNASGVLGDGTNMARHTPTHVGLTNAIALTMADIHTCVVTSDKRAMCWGFNSSGELGGGTNSEELSPVEVTGLTGVVSLAAGDRHTCALLDSGDVVCWGNNTSGELGDGTTKSSPHPVDVIER